MKRLVLALWFVVLQGFGQTSPQPNNASSKEKAKDSPAPEIGILLSEVTVTATRTSEEVKDLPQAITILPADSIVRLQARTPNQMLREEPGIYSVQVAAQGSPIVRGQIGNRVLYLWDGIRINNGAIFGGPNGFFNQVPVGSVERMEVIRGPGAVQFGSDAIGGVINVMTRGPQDFAHDVQQGGELEYRFGAVDHENTGLANYWLATRRFTLMANFSGQDVDDYRVPHLGIMKNTGFASYGGSVSFGFKLTDKDSIHASYIQNRRVDVATYSQSKLNPSGVPRITGPLEQRGIAKIDYVRTNSGRWSDELRLYAYSQFYGGVRDQTVESAKAFTRTRTDAGQDVWGGGAQNASRWKQVKLIYGSDYHTESLKSDKRLYTTSKGTGGEVVTIPNGNVPPGNYNVYDMFGIAQIQVVRRLIASAGVRYETTRLISFPRPEDALIPFTVRDLTLDKRWNAVTWNAGAVYHATNELSFNVNIATGFRAPTFNDTLSTGVPVFASGIASVPSPNVGPERSTSYEVGSRYASRRLTASVTFYTNELRDFLLAKATGFINIPGIGVVVARNNVNGAEGYVRGIESYMAYQVHPTLLWYGNFTYTRGMDTIRNVRLRFIPPAFGTTGFRYTPKRQNWWVDASVNMADRLRHHAPDDELDAGFSRDPGYGSPSATNPAYRPGFQIPGYAIANLRLGYDLFKDRKAGWGFFVNFSNLLNQDYRESYSQQQLRAPGFATLIGTKFRF